MKLSGLILVFLLCGLGGFAQVPNLMPQWLSSNQVDSLALIEQGLPTSKMIDPALIKGRLKEIERQIPLTYHQQTHQFVEYFSFQKAGFTQRMLEKRDLYFPLYEKYLKQYQLPDELKYLSLIESGLEPQALSNKGAGGLWQFMPYTARGDFGLRVDAFIDERFNPEKSTEAACKYLKQLYRIFGDWHLALAAYNTGPGNVKRAIRNCGKADFWAIYPCLPKQTRAYVPQFIAMNYMMNFHWDHQIHPELWLKEIPSDTVLINGYTNLALMSHLSGFSLDTLKKLNPQLMQMYLPKDALNYPVRVPLARLDYFKNHRQAILDSAQGAGRSLGLDSLKLAKELKTFKVRYRVKRGEDLLDLARKFDVSLKTLKQLNRRRSNKLRKGQLIWVLEKRWVDMEAMAQVKAQDSALSAGKKYLSKPSKVKYYRVKPGDTLSEIAAKYANLTVGKLKKLNRVLSKNPVLKPGMKIRIS